MREREGEDANGAELFTVDRPFDCRNKLEDKTARSDRASRSLSLLPSFSSSSSSSSHKTPLNSKKNKKRNDRNFLSVRVKREITTAQCTLLLWQLLIKRRKSFFFLLLLLEQNIHQVVWRPLMLDSV